MNILWITWKDSRHPEAGGAERVCKELCERLIRDGHKVTLLTSDYKGATDDGGVEGATIIRAGSSRYTHPVQALAHYIRKLRGKFDLVIEEVNGGAPYFAVFFGGHAKTVLLYHQLGRKNWLYEIKPPFGRIGYHVMVPIATRLMSWSRAPLITVSESTKQVMARHGFKPEKTHIISEGLHIEPIQDIKKTEKFERPTVLSHGGMRSMKRTIDQVKAFELAKQQVPELQMKISGSSSGPYGKQVLDYIAKSPYKKDIEYLGRTTDEEKTNAMRRSHAILVTSIEEGWGLIVTETNSQGTPAIVYDVDGLRDSVRPDTGIITAENPRALADGILALFANEDAYEIMRMNAWEWSKQLTFERAYEDFKKAVGIA